jgi:hypothetical protein
MKNNTQIDDMYDYNKKREEDNLKKYEDDSKARLKKIISTKLRTSFIGALSSFEETFGRIWGVRTK